MATDHKIFMLRILGVILLGIGTLFFAFMLPIVIILDSLGLKRYANMVGIDWETTG